MSQGRLSGLALYLRLFAGYYLVYALQQGCFGLFLVALLAILNILWCRLFVSFELRCQLIFAYEFVRRRLLSEWLELKKQLIFTDRDYASHVDLIAKVHGLQKAESYIEKLPKSFRSEVVYRSLLGRCASKGYTKKAEEIDL
ncbi:hypothetical protein FXO37_29659 [Capsicum annuum]|nr:hypothetical protein FXO37_29659 [Capsicum annuum]